MTYITPAMRPVDELDGIDDLYLDDTNNLAMATGGDAVGQHARWRTKTFEGEWVFDTEAGVPWLERIMGNAADLPLAEALLKAEIAGTAGVVSIEEFSADYDRATRRVEVKRLGIETKDATRT